VVDVKKSEYIKISKTLIIKLYSSNCFGKGSIYLENLKKGFPPEFISKVEIVMDSLIKQDICKKKKKLHGWKYYLNITKLEKIKEIIR
jgi:hypothetical protein